MDLNFPYIPGQFNVNGLLSVLNLNLRLLRQGSSNLLEIGINILGFEIKVGTQEVEIELLSRRVFRDNVVDVVAHRFNGY